MINTQYMCNVCTAHIPRTEDFNVLVAFQGLMHAELCDNGEHPEDNDRFLLRIVHETADNRHGNVSMAKVTANKLYADTREFDPQRVLGSTLKDLDQQVRDREAVVERAKTQLQG